MRTPYLYSIVCLVCFKHVSVILKVTLSLSIISREFFGQGWMKSDKNEKTPYIMTTTKHFNDVHMYLWWLCHEHQYWNCSSLSPLVIAMYGENHLTVIVITLFTLDLMYTTCSYLHNSLWLCSALQVICSSKLPIDYYIFDHGERISLQLWSILGSIVV